jgi:protein O-mannosyl-transferase
MTVSNTALLRSVAVCALLAAALVWAFGRVHDYAFINFDDANYVYENPHVTQGLTLAGASWAVRSTDAQNWHPLTWLSHMADVELFGLDAGWHHVVNVAFHGANALLLFLGLARMTGATWRSALAAFLFALHPLHVESVAWIAERKDVLSTFFGLLAILAYARYAERRRLGWYLAAWAAAALSLTAKPMLVTLPFVLLLLDFWPLERASSRVLSARGWGRLVTEKIPFVVLSCVSATVTFVAQHEGEAVVDLAVVSFPVRAANAIVSYAKYVLKTLWPSDLSIYYPLSADPPPSWQVVAAGLGIAIITAAVIWSAPRYRYLATGWFWFLGTLVPVIGLVQVGGQAFADRYTYFPSIGLFAIVAWGSYDLLSRASPGHRARWAGAAASVALLFALAVQTRTQVAHWRDSRSVFEHALSVTPENAMAHTKLGEVALGGGDWDAAVLHYGEALRIAGANELTVGNLDYALALRGEAYLWSTQQVAMRAAVRLEPLRYRDFLGAQLIAAGRFEEAAAEFRKALRVASQDVTAVTGIGVALAQGGHLDEAITYFREAVRLDPGNSVAKENLESALAARAAR